MSAWFVLTDRGEVGPISSEELLRRIDGGIIQRDDMVKQDGFEEWTPVSYWRESIHANACRPRNVIRGSLRPAMHVITSAVISAVVAIVACYAYSSWTKDTTADGSALLVRTAANASDSVNLPESLVESVREPVASKTVAADFPPPLLPPKPILLADEPPSVISPQVSEPELLSNARALEALESPHPLVVRKVVAEEVPSSEVAATGQLTIASAKAFLGEPFGVAEVEIDFAEHERPQVRPDDTLFVVRQNGKVFYPAFTVDYVDNTPHHVSKLNAKFLFVGSAPLQVSIAARGTRISDELEIMPIADELGADGARKAWWETFTSNRDGTSQDERQMRYLFAEMLARRMKLPPPSYPFAPTKRGSSIEKYFEQATGLLLGFDSVQLALSTDENDRPRNRGELADRPLPSALVVPSVPLPQSSLAKSEIEPLAQRVPAECFYLRCRSLENYLWLRRLLLNWGGNLSQAVVIRSSENFTRERIERQLAFDPELLQAANLDRSLHDVALIGCDVSFNEGAALGIVFHASDPLVVQETIAQQRKQMLDASPEVTERSLTFDDQSVSFLFAPGNRVRSFYVQDGSYFLVTNSEYIVRRFLATKRGLQSLGSLAEFRYARATIRPVEDEAVFLYVSDPFFRKIVSPKYRIEMQRRRQAAADLEQVRVAYVAAIAEGKPATSIAELIARGYLPSDIRVRPDGSAPLLKQGRVADSLRGAPSCFVPITDVAVGKVTASEVAAYENFSVKYQRQWQVMDPVAVSIGRQKLAENRERVSLEISITPYARDHYRWLQNHLETSPKVRFVANERDLLSFGATVRSSGQRGQVYCGLRDQRVEFDMANGSITPRGLTTSTFGRSRSFLAMTPPNETLLRDIGQTLGVKTNPFPALSSVDVFSLGQRGPIGLAALSLHALSSASQPAVRSIGMSKYVTVDGTWLVFAPNNDFREEVLSTLGTHHGPQSMAYFRMGDINVAEVYPYVRAYTYLSARKLSADNVQQLNSITQQLNLRPDLAMRCVKYLQWEMPVCCLGGQYLTQTAAHGPDVWVSDRWTARSLYDETATPVDYRFHFLEWLRGMEVKFDLNRTTLRAFVELTIDTSLDPENAMSRDRPAVGKSQ